MRNRVGSLLQGKTALAQVLAQLQRDDLIQACHHFGLARRHVGQLRQGRGAQAVLESLARQIAAGCPQAETTLSWRFGR
ncbi:hypothetical protein [Pseudomonas capsici]|uniref:Uncharacterized protein n=1 Tax=Pseudomonas capsici TaxID=2810614 RepID=A0ABT3BX34_9PSED|nr:hypothetical protein [Pseudomonas capsici]MBN6714097.1 hypothetical protein [Pseudomonas capsici]MBN6719347.1 hypothetical protein [Pseudomonas capsici]MBN6722839.1 hypothetical protein [Pseudomonas capsici]MCV4262861.1 hypothetical protein [Pseudomonas capsici]MCV4267751.1 hypothetical protein [Pseudomonas capsici]